MLRPSFYFLFESAIFLIDVQVIAFVKIVADVDIGVQVAIYVAHGHAKAKADKASVNTGRLTYIGKMAPIVAHQIAATTFQKIGYRPIFGTQAAVVAVV